INYDSPLPYFFYRFVLTGKKERKTCLSINFFERKGSGSHYGGGLGGSLGVFGSFDFIRCDIGINRFWSFGKRKGTSFGMGVSMGFIPYIKANMYREESSVSWGYKTEKADAFEGISKINLTMNVEFNQRFKIYKSHAVIIGVRAALESSDGFASEGRIILRDGKVATAFLAYTFGHRILK
ncbi:MAG: hypothetical protein ACXVOH_08905, partial [Bacteroidia bacterium]